MEATFVRPQIDFQLGDIVRAPGKLVLAGEYAILDNAPAIVLAINRGVECRILEGRGIQTPNNDPRFVAHAHPLSEQFLLQFQDWNPIEDFPSHQKPGFGGSAAATVVATRLINQPLESALSSHHKIQGSGSGVDVLASILGGMFLWDPNSQCAHSLSPFHPVVVWTGTSAKTGPRVQQYLQYKNRDWFVQNSIRYTQLFLDDPIRGCKALYQNLNQLSKEANIAYSTPSIVEIVDLAETNNGAAKPSGAGGGDCIVAFFANQADEQRFRSAIDAHPIYQCIEIAVSQGVHLVRPENPVTIA